MILTIAIIIVAVMAYASLVLAQKADDAEEYRRRMGSLEGTTRVRQQGDADEERNAG